MGRIISLFNQAGGVGKTTTTQNLGYHLARRQNRVLLIDIDPQASLTIFMGIEPSSLKKTIYNSLIPDEEPEDSLSIHQQLHDMDLVPANILLANAEQELIFEELRELRLKQVINPIKDDYDFILIDCPPSLGILSYISLVAATHILIPLECQFKALMGTDSLLQTVARVKKRLNPELKIAGFVPTMYQSRNSLDKRTYESIREQLSPIGEIFTPIPRATSIAEAAELAKPLALSNNKHKATLALFDELALAMEKL